MISESALDCLNAFDQSGWVVRRLPEPLALPPAVLQRYGWLPNTHRQFVEALDVAVCADQKAWLLTTKDFSGRGSSAYAWNEWEQLSLAAAEDDTVWARRIRQFWSDHFPIGMSVRSGYAFFAVEARTLRIVVGEEPEFEEVVVVAGSLIEFLRMVAAADPSITRWVRDTL